MPLTPPPDREGTWLFRETGWVRADKVPLRKLWSVDADEVAPRSGGASVTERGRHHYLFMPLEGPSPDHVVGHLLRSAEGAHGTPDFYVAGVPWGVIRGESGQSEMSRNLRAGRPALVTFDGISLWRVLGYFAPASEAGLSYELRRHAAVGFVTTDSLLFGQDLSFMADARLRGETERIIRDLEEAIAGEKWEAVLLRAGDACDRILLDALLTKQAAGTTLQAPGSGGTDPRRWTLASRLEESVRVGILNRGSVQHRQVDVARSFVNLHHAGAAQVRQLDPGPHDAAGCYAAVRNLISWMA